MVSALVTIVVLQVLTVSRLPVNCESAGVHTVVLNWPPTEILPGSVASGYVASWRPHVDVSIVAVQIWMGNPSGIRWEGDVYLTLNNQGDFHSPDQVIVHYQFDKHAESSAPHQLWFQVGSNGSGFVVEAGETVWFWSAFKNISDNQVFAGDGQVIIYYLND